jgi:hypothetical protein
MVSHYAASLTFDDAIQLYKQATAVKREDGSAAQSWSRTGIQLVMEYEEEGSLRRDSLYPHSLTILSE